MKPLLSFLLMFLPFILMGQELQLHNGTKHKIFDANTFYEVYANEMTEIEGASSLLTYHLMGKIRRIHKDSITFTTYKLERNFVLEKGRLDDYLTTVADGFSTTFAKEDVVQLSRFKSQKQKKTKEILRAFGGVLISIGVLSAATSPIIENKEDKRRLLGLASLEFGLGLTMALIGGRKKYQFYDEQKPWRFLN